MNHQGFRVLLERARDGDRGAMDEVLSKLQPHLEPVARRYADPTRPVGTTTDLLQESCLRAWQKLDSFESDQDDEETFAMFRAWMAQIVRRLGMNAQRDRAAKKRIPSQKIKSLGPETEGAANADEAPEPSAPGPTPSAHVRAGETSRLLSEALDDLPDPVASQIVRMRHFEGLTIPEIAERLGMGAVRVRERHRSAMRRLRRRLGDSF
ncbi:MAG: sigma-70 family RNA polymerase sigma factor [Planctomycetota bacterium]|nr:sigma-70 family RNA polymerase sigma factor [Planctomycetota bacterium]